MPDILGISFSDNEIYLGRKQPQGEDGWSTSIKGVPYPFSFGYDTLFVQTNIDQIASLVREEKEKNQMDRVSLSVVLPQNYAFSKRVAVPFGSDPALLKKQAQWELGTLLPGDMASYKIVKTGQTFQMNNYEEHLFVAIRRSVLDAVQNLSASAQTEPGRVLLEDAALHNYLDSAGLLGEGLNQLAVKIEQNLLKNFLFIDGQFFHCSFERLPASGEQDAAGQAAALIKQRYKESVALLEQLSIAGENELQLLFWGSAIDDQLRALLAENFKQEMSELTAETTGGATPAVELMGLLQS